MMFFRYFIGEMMPLCLLFTYHFNFTFHFRRKTNKPKSTLSGIDNRLTVAAMKITLAHNQSSYNDNNNNTIANGGGIDNDEFYPMISQINKNTNLQTPGNNDTESKEKTGEFINNQITLLIDDFNNNTSSLLLNSNEHEK